MYLDIEETGNVHNCEEIRSVAFGSCDSFLTDSIPVNYVLQGRIIRVSYKHIRQINSNI